MISRVIGNLEKSDFFYLIYKNKTKMETKQHYRRIIENIIKASDLITEWTLKGDIDKVDLYRIFLNEMVDKAVDIKKFMNDGEFKKNG
jgi:hypothetical protein